MKKLLVLILGVSFISVALSSTTEASAREWDSIECQPGFYWKKGGWTLYPNAYKMDKIVAKFEVIS